MRTDLTAEKVRELLDYDPETGVLTWKVRPEGPKNWNTRYAGKPAGNKVTFIGSRTTYLGIKVDYASYPAHRVVWLIQTGSWPAGDISHIDGNGYNNSWHNLQDATTRENCRNRPLRHDNKSGHNGVFWHIRIKKWQANIRDDTGRLVHLGYFVSIDDAIAARKRAERSLDYHPNHGRPHNPDELGSA